MKFGLIFFAVVFLLIGCEDILVVEDIKKEKVRLISPYSNAVIYDSEINFNWELVDEAESYRLQITYPNFQEATQIILDSVVSTTQFSIILSPNNYEWRVKGINSEYSTEYSTSNFRVEE